MRHLASLLDLQSRSRLNARRAVQSLDDHRDDRQEADRAVRAAAAGRGLTARRKRPPEAVPPPVGRR